MEYVKYGRAGFKTSRVILGTMNFGPFTPEKESFAIMDRALDEGINHFDTANVYGAHLGAGATEEVIGSWFQIGGKRQKLILATKCNGDMGDQIGQGGVNALNIRRSCEASLKRLKTDYIDLYIMHHIDRLVQPEEWMQAMEQLIREGKILYVGSSNFTGWSIAQAMERQKSRDYLGLVSEQHSYNLTTREAELEVIPACEEYGLAFTPYGPLSGGMLAGRLADVKEGRRSTDWMKNHSRKFIEGMQRYENFCAKIDQDPAVVGQAWLLQNPHVTAVIAGPRTMKQLEDAVAAQDFRFTKEQLNEVENIFSTPKGAAPESYAW
jgi:aryl-alcohol dehydrogenase-like predicted oxidoreductase